MRHLRRESGFSLVEMAVVMLLISLALVPVVNNINGQMSTSGEGNVTRVTGNQNRMVVAANTILERASSGEFEVIDACGPNGMPGEDETIVYNMCQSSDIDIDYGTPVFFRWTVSNLTAGAGLSVPVGNEYYRATLEVFEENNANQPPILTLPTYFFRNVGAGAQQGVRTSFLVSLDMSGSMLSSMGGGGSAKPWKNSPTGCGYYYHEPSGQIGNGDNSRIEAARNSILKLIDDVMANATLAQDIDIGFQMWSGGWLYGTNNIQASIEAFPYTNTKNHVLALNRNSSLGCSPFVHKPSGGTPMYRSLTTALNHIQAQEGYQNRIVLLINDGGPNAGCPGSGLSCSWTYPSDKNDWETAFSNLAEEYGQDRNPADWDSPIVSERPIEIYTIGAGPSAPILEDLLDENIAQQTHNGFYMPATDQDKLEEALDQIKYQLFRMTLVSRMNRYGLEYN